MPHGAHAAVEGVQIADVLPSGSFSLDQQHLRLDRADHALRDFVLDREDVRHIAVESLAHR